MSSQDQQDKGLCTHIVYTLVLKYLKRTTLRPKYILVGYIKGQDKHSRTLNPKPDPSGQTFVATPCVILMGVNTRPTTVHQRVSDRPLCSEKGTFKSSIL